MSPGLASGWTITLEAAPTEEDFAAIFRPLDWETAQVTGPCAIRPLALLLRNAQGQPAGGIWGRVVYQWLVIEMLYVPPPCRGAGIGRALMRQAEKVAVTHSCIGLHITRLDFQAPRFYEALGFTTFGVQQDVPPGHCCYYMAKRIG